MPASCRRALVHSAQRAGLGRGLLVLYAVMTPLRRSVRLVAIRDKFLAGGSYTTAQLADEFGVGHSTIWKDIQLLQGEPFFLPLTMERIQEVHWQLMDLEH